jgi:chitin disaccharide deacetylase
MPAVQRATRPRARPPNNVNAAAEPLPRRRRIWLCADDYGISESVDIAIRDLAVRGRLNATSAMVVAPSMSRSEASALDMLNAKKRHISIGLHLTLTAPFRPLSTNFAPTHQGTFMSLQMTLLFACLGRLQRGALADEIAEQLKRFIATFGRVPDFIDGHQHVHLFPQIRDIVLELAKARAPGAWVRQCGSVLPVSQKFHDRKSFLLDILSRGFRRRAKALAVRTNPAFAGTYNFGRDVKFADLFPRFLDRLPDGSVVMCHPGFVDDELRKLDPLTTEREREFAFFADDAFPALLDRHGLELAG